MPFDPKKQIVFSVDGQLTVDGKHATDMESVVAAIPPETDTLVVWFHGGLVSTSAGIEIADRVGKFYSEGLRGIPDAFRDQMPQNPYSIFFVWESGPGKSLLDAIIAILERALMKAAMDKLGELLSFKITAFTGGLGMAEVGDVPEELSQEEQDVLVEALMADPEFLAEAQAMAGGAKLAAAPGLAVTPARAEASERIDSFIKDNLPETDAKALGVSPLQAIKIAKAIVIGLAKITVRVMRRINGGRGHGTKQTVIEETARELGVPEVWTQIKRYTDEAFKDGGVGDRFLEALEKANLPESMRIVLVGHSTGAIYIANLLNHPRMADFQFDVRFLAPAIRFDRFAEMLQKQAPRIRSFRSYGMQDLVEKAELLFDLPVIDKVKLLRELYVGSLLYMVSGAFEFRTDSDAGSGDYGDCPLLGMERYALGSAVLTSDEKKLIGDVRAVYDLSHWIYGPTPDGAPFPCSSRTHGGFDDVDDKGVPEGALWSLLLA